MDTQIDDYIKIMTELKHDFSKSIEFLCKNIPKDSKLVSVGSGVGIFEHILLQNRQDIKLICIDPNPLSYVHAETDKVIMKPSYKSVDDFIKLNHDFSNYDLLLVRPTPKLTYDFDALCKLNSKNVYIMYENTGGDGSELLNKYLNSINKPMYNEINPIWQSSDDLSSQYNHLKYKWVDHLVFYKELFMFPFGLQKFSYIICHLTSFA